MDALRHPENRELFKAVDDAVKQALFSGGDGTDPTAGLVTGSASSGKDSEE